MTPIEVVADKRRSTRRLDKLIPWALHHVDNPIEADHRHLNRGCDRFPGPLGYYPEPWSSAG